MSYSCHLNPLSLQTDYERIGRGHSGLNCPVCPPSLSVTPHLFQCHCAGLPQLSALQPQCSSICLNWFQILIWAIRYRVIQPWDWSFNTGYAFSCGIMSRSKIDIRQAPNAGGLLVWQVNLWRLSAALSGECLYQRSHVIKNYTESLLRNVGVIYRWAASVLCCLSVWEFHTAQRQGLQGTFSCSSQTQKSLFECL